MRAGPTEKNGPRAAHTDCVRGSTRPEKREERVGWRAETLCSPLSNRVTYPVLRMRSPCRTEEGSAAFPSLHQFPRSSRRQPLLDSVTYPGILRRSLVYWAWQETFPRYVADLLPWKPVNRPARLAAGPREERSQEYGPTHHQVSRERHNLFLR